MPRTYGLVALFLLVAVALGASAQRKKAPKLKGGKSQLLDVEVDGAEGMRFYLHLPKGWKAKSKHTYPVLLTLHGNGGSPSRMLDTFEPLSSKKSPLIILSLGYQKEQRSNAPQWPRPVANRATQWLFDTAVSEWHGDPNRLFIQGFSRGGGEACFYARHQASPEFDGKNRLRGVVLNSGFMWSSRPDWPDAMTLCVAGALETDVNGTNYVEAATQCANSLFRKGIPVRRHLIPGMGHAVNAACVELVRDLIFEECASSASLKNDARDLKKRWRKHERRYTALRHLKQRLESLEAGSERDGIAKILGALEADERFAAERTAWDALAEARKADKPGAAGGRAAYEALAKSHPKTEAGRIAKDRLEWIDTP